MGFFTNRAERREDVRIDAFWAWWAAEGAVALASAFDGEEGLRRGEITGELVRRVQTMHPDVDFETGAGRTARHQLVVTGFDAPLRAFATRWLAAAPEVSDAWEFAATRQPVADPSGIAFRSGDGRSAGVVIDAASVLVGVTASGPVLDLVLTHPAFASLPDDEQGRWTFLMLDAVLGEDAVERFVGVVEWGAAAPDGALTVVQLREAVEDFIAQTTAPR